MQGVTYLDVETTGLYPTSDRIVQISLKNDTKTLNILLNPQQPINKEAMDVHKITDDMVKGKPTFNDVINSIMPFFDTTTCKYICGYNVSFDFKFLQKEFSLCNLFLESRNYKFLDPLAIHKALCPNDLASMYRRYTGNELVGGHDAEVDMMACLTILSEQQRRTGKGADELSDLSGMSNRTIGGWLERSPSGYIFLAGKYKGQTLDYVINVDADYIKWVLSARDISFEEQLIFKNLYR